MNSAKKYFFIIFNTVVSGLIILFVTILIHLGNKVSKLEGKFEVFTQLQKEVKIIEENLKNVKDEIRYIKPILISPNSKYQATLVGLGKDFHYQIKEIATNYVMLTTHAKYKTPNDVKAGLFSPDSKKFAAAYHYGYEGNHTWIGTWDIKNRDLIDTKERSGWINDISWIFK